LILVTDNTRGLGESVEYVGTQAINEATRDRFYFVEFGSMEPAQELAIATSEAAHELPPILNGGASTKSEGQVLEGDADETMPAAPRKMEEGGVRAISEEGDVGFGHFNPPPYMKPEAL
jgi:hypothetical protein